MSDENEPHPDNAPGVFYVTAGCCTACGVPLDAAPELFAYDQSSHCYVKRQPSTVGETEGALNAVRRAELACIRYRGDDPEILQRFAELDQLQVCDAPAARGLRPMLRNHVAFDSADPDTAAWSRKDLVAEFVKHVVSLSGPSRYRLSSVEDDGRDANVKVAWYEEQFHSLFFRRVDAATGRWMIRHLGNLGVSELVDRWLKTDGRFSGMRWYAGLPEDRPWEWRETPW